MISKELQFTRHGHFREVLSLQERVLPSQVTAGHVRVKAKARAINPADFIFIAGHYAGLIGDQITQQKPQTAGSEFAGEIVEIGAGVTQWQLGDRIYCVTNFPYTRSWAEYVDLDVASSLMVKLPDAVTDASACQLFVNPLTAMGFLETLKSDGLVEGDYYAMTAAGSSLCRMVLNFAKERKCPFQPIAIVRRESQRKELEAMSANVICTDTENVKERVQEITKGKGIKVIFDAIAGGKVSSDLIDTLALHGTSYMYGMLDDTPLSFNTGNMCFKDLRVAGWWLGHFLAKNGEQIKPMLQEVLGYLASGSVTFPAKEFDMVTQHQAAFDHATTQGKCEKTVLSSCA